MASPPKILVLSIGNLGPHLNSLHSIGHHALSFLHSQLPSQPPFHDGRLGGPLCAVSPGDDYILARSPTSMNLSGPWASRAWQHCLDQQHPGANLGLAVILDDLRTERGRVKMKDWGGNDYGHGGMRSILAALRKDRFPGKVWRRVHVGIGKPEDGVAVRDWVLRNIERREVDEFDERWEVGRRVRECLAGMRAEMEKGGR